MPNTPWTQISLGTNGFAWHTQSQSPDVSLGNGLCYFRYLQSNGNLFFRLVLVGGTTTTYGNAGDTWVFTLPYLFGSYTRTEFLYSTTFLVPAVAQTGLYGAFQGQGQIQLTTINGTVANALLYVRFPSHSASFGGSDVTLAADVPATWGTGGSSQLIVGNAVEAYQN